MKERENKGLPVLQLEKFKKILKNCSTQVHCQCQHRHDNSEDLEESSSLDEITRVESQRSCVSGCCCCCSELSDNCPVCDGIFFPSFLEEMSAVACCFNKRAKKLLRLHLASRFKKIILQLISKYRKNHRSLRQQGEDLLTYALVNYIAMRKILKKYDKIHCSKRGQTFRTKAENMHIEILQSPWICELIAFNINAKQKKAGAEATASMFNDCSIIFENEHPSLSCGFFDSVKLDINLACTICLETLFDPVSLICGHIFCYMCCCSAASVTIVDGLKSADRKAKCPLCRRDGVYESAEHLDELNLLLSRSCPDYWKERLRTERVERVRLTKQYWEAQCQAFTGI